MSTARCWLRVQVEAGYVALASTLFGLVGTVGIGWLADYYRRIKLLLLIILSAGTCKLTLTLVAPPRGASVAVNALTIRSTSARAR